MDLNLIRSLVTVLAFIVFVAIVVRAWSAANRERYAEAAALPFADEPEPPGARPAGARRDPAPHKAILRAVDPGPVSSTGWHLRREDGRTEMAIAGVNAASTGTTRNE